MKLAVSEPVAAPRAQVFASVTDFDALTARLTGSALRLTRKPVDHLLEVDSAREDEALVRPAREHWAWEAELHLHGVVRKGHAQVTELRPPEGYVIEGLFEAVAATLAIEIAGAGPTGSTLGVTVTALPRSLSGRVLVQPLRLMQQSLRDRMAERLARFAREIEAAATDRA